MIPWWGWVMVWSILVIGLIAMLAGSAWWLFRKSMSLLEELTMLTERAALLEIPAVEHERPALAVLAQLTAIREREDRRRHERAQRRWRRREARWARARRITSADPSQIDVPPSWRS